MKGPRSAISLMLLLSPALIRAQEQEIKIKDAPTAVIQNVSMRFRDAKVQGVAKETNDQGQQVYEVTLKRAGRNIDVTTTPDGKLTLIEREITRAQLPPAVSSALRSQYPGATYKMVEEVTNVSGSVESLAFYEVLLVGRKKDRLEVEVSPEGKILKVEKKKPGEPD